MDKNILNDPTALIEREQDFRNNELAYLEAALKALPNEGPFLYHMALPDRIDDKFLRDPVLNCEAYILPLLIKYDYVERATGNLIKLAPAGEEAQKAGGHTKYQAKLKRSKRFVKFKEWVAFTKDVLNIVVFLITITTAIITATVAILSIKSNQTRIRELEREVRQLQNSLNTTQHPIR